MRLHVALAIFEEVPRGFLDDPVLLRAALHSAVTHGKFTPYETVVVKFTPQGVTACAVVGESHLALHSWPEEGRLFLDIASWWLTKVSTGFAYVVMIGGVLMGLSFAFQWLVSFYQILFFKCPPDESCTP